MSPKARLGVPLLCVVLVVSTGHRAAGEITAEQIDTAIDKGMASIWSQQAPDGSFTGTSTRVGIGSFRSGEILATVAAACSGQDVEDPRLQKLLTVLVNLEFEQTYELAYRTVALAELSRRLPDRAAAAVRERMKKDVLLLQRLQVADGGWTYKAPTSSGGTSDFSNTRAAVVALGEAALAGVPVDTGVIRRAERLYLSKQGDDGGWNYLRSVRRADGDEDGSYGSMTAGGVACLHVAQRLLNPGQGCPCRSGRSQRAMDDAAEKAVGKGLQWLADNFSANSNPKTSMGFVSYWLLCCERVGMLTGCRSLGGHDWYKEGAEYLISKQEADGGWRRLEETAQVVSFLARGRGPMLLGKLRHSGQWNNHPADADNLARYFTWRKGTPVRWQVVDVDAPLEVWREAPLVYLSAETVPQLNADQKKKLREFTDTGGTLFIEATCGNNRVAMWARNLCKEIWPEWDLAVLDKSHPIWSADEPVGGRLPLLKGVDDGMRVRVLCAEHDVSCGWNLSDVGKNRVPLGLGLNMVRYANAGSDPENRWLKHEAPPAKYAAQATKTGARDRIAVARIKYQGAWSVGDAYSPWLHLGVFLSKQPGLYIRRQDPVNVGGLVPKEVDLLHLTGRNSCDLGEGGAEWLKQSVAEGTMLFVEAAAGDAEFDNAVRELLATARMTLKPVDRDSPLVTGNLLEATGYRISAVRRVPAASAEKEGDGPPLLYTIHSDERLVGFYSPLDITFSLTGYRAFGCRGYAAEDARAIAANLALTVSIRAR